MNIKIDKSNYEEFYLDFLEGNLSGEALVAFEAFLAENPDLAVSDELIFLEPDSSVEEFGAFDKLLLKKQVEISELNAENIDYFLIASAEGLLSSKDQAYLNNWLEENPKFKRDAALIEATKSEADLSVVYEDKESLKHKTRIIPMWWSGVAAAAAAVLLIITFSWNTGEVAKPANVVASADSTGVVQQPQTANSNVQVVPSENNGTGKVNGNGSVKIRNNQHVTVPAPGAPENKKGVEDVKGLEFHKAVIQNKPVQLAELNIPEPQPQKTVQPEPETYASVDKMANPIKPVTKAISEKLDTPVDFRTAKAAKKQGGGFYLKLGKLEVSHTTASMH